MDKLKFISNDELYSLQEKIRSQFNLLMGIMVDKDNVIEHLTFINLSNDDRYIKQNFCGDIMQAAIKLSNRINAL